MNYRFANMWLKAFRDSAESVCMMYADDSLFEDLMLDQSITDKEDLHRVFAPYANADPSNGVGIHNFGIHEYIGDQRQGLIRWYWNATDTAIFLGLPTEGKLIATEGQTCHLYENGHIVRESTFWDATAVLNLLGYEIDTAVVRLPSAGSAGTASSNGGASGEGPSPGVRLDRAKAWATALTEDTDRLLGMYADEFTSQDRRVADVVTDVITEKDVLRDVYAPFANKDRDNGVGVHSFEAAEWIGDESRGVILWNWSAEDIASYRGIPTGGAGVKTFGQTYHEYDGDGRIVRESTFWNDVPAFQALGLPVLTIHYWDADFDPSTMMV